MLSFLFEVFCMNLIFLTTNEEVLMKYKRKYNKNKYSRELIVLLLAIVVLISNKFFHIDILAALSLGDGGSSIEHSVVIDDNLFEGYEIIEVDGGDLSGHREKNVAVDIGFGDREYWAFTNEYGQLVKVVAKQIILQDDKKEPVLKSGRYYPDEARVKGTELKIYDQGHVIADSLGGVANAYNITPQHYIMNRHGDQAYMEDNIRKAGGCTDFLAEIYYPNTETQIPSRYKIIYILKGNVIVENFKNESPE